MKKYWIAAAVLVALLVGAYIGSPYYAVHSFRSAVQAGDVAGMEARVDFPAVRESLKSQISAQMTKAMAEDPALKDNPFSGMAAMMLPAIIDRTIEAYVTPAGIAAVVKNTQLVPGKDAAASDGKVVSSSTYVSLNRFQVDVHPEKAPAIKSSMIFARDGLFAWKLVRLDLPEGMMGKKAP